MSARRPGVRAGTGRLGWPARLRPARGWWHRPARQLVKKPADHLHLPGTELALALGGGGGRQHRRQRLAGQCVAWSQIGGLVDAPGGFGAADQRRLGDRMRELAAQLFGGGLAGNGIDQRVLERPGCGGATARSAPTTPAALGGQRLAVKLDHPIEGGIQPIKSRRQLLPINTTASHNPKLSGGTDKKCCPETTETKVAEVISSEVISAEAISAEAISARVLACADGRLARCSGVVACHWRNRRPMGGNYRMGGGSCCQRQESKGSRAGGDYAAFIGRSDASGLGGP